MKTKRYSTEQIIGILKEAEAGMPVKELCRKYGVSEAQRLKELESENHRLKKLQQSRGRCSLSTISHSSTVLPL
ncbi:transposase IS3/IS911 family protein [Prosthecochloris aestuarii DSM 271]|uniref:Transposase IS3/IS911 family protein n=1 Tax=Prosthecochloris aestuarii (strain DSM 271 / SK 413) TaxID=290512 RepID=B4S509_PROA2|nr:transposase IS3/IS911 family protein [Prosthecochloris aestuarii DSM 271]